MSSEQSGPNERSPFQQALHEIIDPFKSLADSPRALWGLYISYLLEGLVYFGVLTILGKYLSENVGLADLHAGWVYSGFTGGITLAMLFLGGVADRIGVRRAMLLSLGVMVFGRFLLGASGTFFEQGAGAGSPMFFVVILGLAIVVFGYGTYQPAAYSAVKRFTSKKTASMGYAMIYGLMNLGAFFSGIISPPIRKSLGIESVYWVYTGVTVLAFLTVLFIMTRRVVARDTLTVIDAAPAGEDAGDAKPDQPKLMTPTFMTLVAASLLSVAMIVAMVITAQPGPAQQPVRDAKFEMQRMELALADAEDQSARVLLIRGTASRFDEYAVATAVPTDGLDPDASVDGSPIETASERLRSAAGIMRVYADLPDLAREYHLTDADSSLVVGAVRLLGLTYLATAYAMVSPVDDEVLDNLRNRIKEPGAEAPDPLPDEDRARIMALVRSRIDAKPDLLIEATRAAEHRVATASGGVGELLAPFLATDAGHLERIGAMLEGADARQTATVEELLKDQLLQLSVFYTADLPGTLAAGAGMTSPEEGFFVGIRAFFGGGDDEEFVAEPRTFTAEDVFLTWTGAEVGAADELDASVGGAVTLPGGKAFAVWGKRYGVWVLAMVVFLALLGRNMLQKRPEHPFHDRRFVFFIFVLIPVQTLFAHNWLTLPYYINRAFGGTTVGENFEFFSNLNPILIFFLAPMVAALTTRAKVYPMMIWGTLVMAAPTFLLVLPPAPVFLLTYIVLMSIGEAMWQPRFLQWVAEIAPEGQTGAYMGIGQFPWFLTKVLTGLYSGAFLAKYCPMVGPQNTQFMWLVYGLIAMVSPVALVLAAKWMTAGMKEKHEG